MSFQSSALKSTCLLSLLVGFLLSPSLGQAATTSSHSAVNASEDSTDDSDNLGYDVIVRDLSREVDKPAPGALRAKIKAKPDPFETVMFHGGVGVAMLAETVSVGNRDLFLNQKGLQLAFGIDLFSPNWLAEGTYRNFTGAETSSVETALQEFEMKFFYKDKINSQFGYRAGGGLSARYLNVHVPGGDSTTYTTPSAVATGGVDCFITDKFSIGFDLSLRSAMITDTPDKNSIDGTVRMDAHF